MEVSKIGGCDFPIKTWHHCKCNTNLNAFNQGHRHVGPFSRVEYFNEGVILDLRLLCPDNPDQSMRSQKHELKQIHRIDTLEGAMSQYFCQNKRCNGVFIETTWAFSDLKFTEENFEC